MIKWEDVKHKKDLFELKKDEYNKWTIPQLCNILFLKRVLKMEHYQQQIKKLIKLRIEWESKLETDWIFVKEYFKKEQQCVNSH